MDPRSLAHDRAPSTEHEAAHAALLDAAKDVLDWLRRFQKHAPQEARFGGEERLTRKLSAAVRACSFEIRPCANCAAGTIPRPTAHPAERLTPAPCPECGGSGRVKVFSYGTPKSNGRGRA